ncbi:hypothetical protein [Xylophilus sp.]|uniref:hypothetical protein n=1 Tax=Xylophilus sp. TaxID=2653893 RepID=UPI0013BE0DF1|nr:hypothetical protein [Xylophilus sp.]KAF1046723.1 MAG: hypothetical protein GAK38_02286 [Xylophilus sp.]
MTSATATGSGDLLGSVLGDGGAVGDLVSTVTGDSGTGSGDALSTLLGDDSLVGSVVSTVTDATSGTGVLGSLADTIDSVVSPVTSQPSGSALASVGNLLSGLLHHG